MCALRPEWPLPRCSEWPPRSRPLRCSSEARVGADDRRMPGAAHDLGRGVGGGEDTGRMAGAGSGAGRAAKAARELLRWRLESQGVAPARDASVTEVVDRLLAMQAQDFAQGSWAIGLRAPGSTRADLTAALDSGEIVRSWPMRGTLHFTRPDDLRWMLALTAQRTVRSMAKRHRDLGLDDVVVARATAIARTELRGGGALSREEFTALLETGGIATDGQRGMHLIWRLAHDGLICWGPARGTQQAMVLLDEWAPPTHEHARDEALGEFVLRYVTGHGPATLKDFCWWSKVSVADASLGLDHVRDRLREIELGGTSYWVAADTTEREARAPSADTAGDTISESGAGRSVEAVPPARPPASRPGARAFHALPGFDEYLLGYPNRAPALPEAFAARIVPGDNGIFLPMLVSRGTVVGTWKRALTASKVTITPTPFAPLSAAEQTGFEREFRRFSRFLGLTLVVADGLAP